MGYFKVWLKSFAMELSKELTYKWNFIIKALALVSADIVGPLIILLIYTHTSGIPGWSFEQFILFQGTFILIFGLNHLLQIRMPIQVMDEILEGTFDKYLIRPFNTLMFLTVTSWDLEGAAEVLVGTGLVAWAMAKLGISVFSVDFLAYIYLLFLAYVFFYCLMVLISSLGFLVVKSYAFFNLFFKMSDFARYPLDIYSPALRLVLTFIFPISVASFYPTTVLLEGVKLAVMVQVTIPVIVIFALTMVAWEKAMKKYSSAGG